MKNAMRLIMATALAALVTLGLTGAAQAADDNYVDPNVQLNIPGDILIGGNTFDYEATASVECDWTISYAPAVNGPVVQTGSGTSTTGTYDTPPVDERTDTTITATCEYEAFALGGSSVQAAATDSASATVTLLPLGDDDNAGGGGDGLPGAGGSSLWPLVLGAGLVLMGGGAYVISRRRA